MSVTIANTLDKYEIASSEASPLLTGLISYWKFEESSGGTITDAHGDNDGTSSNITPQQDGIIDYGHGFSGGSNSYIDMGNPANLQLSDSGGISIWLKPSSTANPTYPFSKGDLATATNGYGIWCNGTQVYAIIGNATTQTYIDKTGIYTASVWNHIVMTWNTSKLYLYVNNNVASIDIVGLALSTTYNLYIGRDAVYGATYDYSGIIDEVGIWNRLLTAEEVEDLYNSGNGLAYPFS